MLPPFFVFAVEVQDPYFGNDLIHLHTGCKLKVSETRYAFSKITVVSNNVFFIKIYHVVLLFKVNKGIDGRHLAGTSNWTQSKKMVSSFWRVIHNKTN